MKKSNQLLYITNIIFCALSIIPLLNQCYLVYDSFDYMFSALCFAVMIINIIMSIINFRKRQFIIAILGITIALVLCFTYMIHILIIGSIISLIASAFGLFLSFNLEQTYNSKVPFIMFCIFNILIFFITLTPFIMNYVNEKNIEKVLSNINEDSYLETYISEDENEYIFYNKKGKEINRVSKDLYGRIYTTSSKNNNKYKLMATVVNVDGSKIVLGITEKGIIINPKGEKLMKLCNIFDDSFSVYVSFLNYITIEKNMIERFILIFSLSFDIFYLQLTSYIYNCKISSIMLKS